MVLYEPFYHGSVRTADARGIKQWNSAGRKVIKGSHAIYILVPRIKKVEKQMEGVDYETTVIKGFLAQPVFRVEDTEGEPWITRKRTSCPVSPDGEGQRMGIKVKGMRFSSFVLGAYDHHNQEIVLATPAESVFFHELAHAAHARLGEDCIIMHNGTGRLLRSCLLKPLSTHREETPGYPGQLLSLYRKVCQRRRIITPDGLFEGG